MLWTIAVILPFLWAVGLVTSYTMGGFIHGEPRYRANNRRVEIIIEREANNKRH